MTKLKHIFFFLFNLLLLSLYLSGVNISATIFHVISPTLHEMMKVVYLLLSLPALTKLTDINSVIFIINVILYI